MAVSRHKAVPRTKADPNAIPIATAAKDLGAFLRVAFAESSEQALPDIFEQLLARLGAGEAPPPPRPEALPDNEFKVQLAAVIPHLRAFGRSLSGFARPRRRSGAGNAAQGMGGA